MSKNRTVSEAEAPQGFIPLQAFMTPKWAIFAISVSNAVDFAPECVEVLLWSTLHGEVFSYSGAKFVSRRVQNLSVNRS